jgi:predicted RNA-binding Zn-ribbon protein involved in translation (DUF1610 family)
MQQNSLKKEIKKADKEVKCPKCGSTQITPVTKGFGLGKAALWEYYGSGQLGYWRD